ncbi:hypothetical protein LCIT_03120 [Leuconostoc citreum]|uniref:Uncharacterized protein n=1 Tax=Leuconostoc citreum TaxID=33964 RepID=A0A5A5TWV4_LEUCI|nr:hypothetical protein [Leuconostoc citreum]GDZ83070.1 hypothetical protein LCIT_03120 [Leuconostoc citreum]
MRKTRLERSLQSETEDWLRQGKQLRDFFGVATVEINGKRYLASEETQRVLNKEVVNVR